MPEYSSKIRIQSTASRSSLNHTACISSPRYTYQQAFKQFLQETDDFAGQREVIAEETKNNVLNDMHNVASQSKNERKKALQNLNDLKSHLDQLHKALNVVGDHFRPPDKRWS